MTMVSRRENPGRNHLPGPKRRRSRVSTLDMDGSPEDPLWKLEERDVPLPIGHPDRRWGPPRDPGGPYRVYEH
ncbi:hypothetical protein GCM10029964_054610 [Kibdelosporangium lantanae]